MEHNRIIHLSGLNGLRAIAAMAVIISHITRGLDSFGLNPAIFGKSADGKPIGLLLAGFGVSIFFALSGFLITFLLLKEKEIATINVKKFYVRRALRIWPLYYLYLVVSLLVISYSHIPALEGQTVFYAFMAANVPFILGHALPFIEHYWSLGVEEQFYLFWPWVLRFSNRYLLRLITFAALGLIVLKLIASRMTIHLGPVNLYDVIHVTRFHCMMIGGIGAILYYNGSDLFKRLTTNIPVQIICWLSLVLMALNRFHLASVIDNELVSCMTVCLIMAQITGKNRIVNLNNKLCNFLGKISYGLYVIHPLIICLFSFLIGKWNASPWLKYPVVYACIMSSTVLIAYLSYIFYEKRFLKLKFRFAVVKSSDTSDKEA